MLFRAEWNSTVHTCHIFFNHFSIDGQVGLFHTLTIMISAAISMGVQSVFSTCWFHFFKCIELSII
jgi:hypothetical protein